MSIAGSLIQYQTRKGIKKLSVGSIVQITFGDNGSVEALTSIDNMMSGFGGEGFENFIPPEQNSATDDSGS